MVQSNTCLMSMKQFSILKVFVIKYFNFKIFSTQPLSKTSKNVIDDNMLHQCSLYVQSYHIREPVFHVYELIYHIRNLRVIIILAFEFFSFSLKLSL